MTNDSSEAGIDTAGIDTAGIDTAGIDTAGVDPAEVSGPAPGLAELERTAHDAIAQLAEQTDPEAFQALLRLSALVGECLGVSARTLATTGSWAKVAEVAGTSRQAAWSRWSS